VLVRIPQLHRRVAQASHDAMTLWIHGARRGLQDISLGVRSASDCRDRAASVPGRDM
jgi:hypothetical protein